MREIAFNAKIRKKIVFLGIWEDCDFDGVLNDEEIEDVMMQDDRLGYENIARYSN
jgi:hypothetical protein